MAESTRGRQWEQITKETDGKIQAVYDSLLRQEATLTGKIEESNRDMVEQIGAAQHRLSEEIRAANAENRRFEDLGSLSEFLKKDELSVSEFLHDEILKNKQASSIADKKVKDLGGDEAALFCGILQKLAGDRTVLEIVHAEMLKDDKVASIAEKKTKDLEPEEVDIVHGVLQKLAEAEEGKDPEKGPKKRKQNRAFTETETEAVVSFVEQHGHGDKQWTKLKNESFAEDAHREPGNLKDRWRTLVKAARNHKEEEEENEGPKDKAKKKTKKKKCEISVEILNRVFAVCGPAEVKKNEADDDLVLRLRL